MIVAIDESGDAGRRGSPFFRLAAVCWPDAASVDSFRQGVRDVRRSLGLRSDFEFKFAKTRAEQKAAVFAAALAVPFQFTACSLDKRSAEWARARVADIHWACLADTAATLWPVFRAAGTVSSVWVDNNDDRHYLAAARRHFLSIGAATVRFGDSAKDEVLQLADMVCGAAGNFFDGDDTWYRVIGSRQIYRSLARIP